MGYPIVALFNHWNIGLTVNTIFTVLAFFALVTLGSGCTCLTLFTAFALWALKTLFTLLAVFDNTFSDWVLGLISFTFCIGWVELNGGLFVGVITFNYWNVGLTVDTIFTLLTLSTSCTGFTLFAVFYDTFSDRLLIFICRTVCLGWIEFDGGLFVGVITFNNRNVGLTIYAIFTLLTLGTGCTSFTFFTTLALRALETAFTWVTFSPVLNLAGSDWFSLVLALPFLSAG
ncbi:hypothetical protein [Aerococcus urinae]|uniref:hypothetical protein n=1 Tax=Aerococcus urinae TaxID=1376 RepID=UPI001E342BF6|nr:hypothetical protein [Aerococcus urinae]